jgi:imidazolonepropionase-like amidohydrolase
VRPLLFLSLVLGCAPAAAPRAPAAPLAPVEPVPEAPWRTPEAASHGPDAAPTVLIRGAQLLLGDGKAIDRGHLLLAEGKIAALGEGDGEAPEGATIVDATGKFVTPGLIDTHSHLGVYPSPRADAHLDGNEMTAPITADVRAIDAFWVQDPDIERAVAGGVTTIQVLPGSGNLIGGRAVTLKLRNATTAQAMRFSGAPDGLKMACGENPKRVYGERKQKPMTRMGNLALQRAAFHEARRLIDEWDLWRAEEGKRRREAADAEQRHAFEKRDRETQQAACARGDDTPERCASLQKKWQREPLRPPVSLPKLPPMRNLLHETLAAALEGRVLVHVHCYRSDDMANVLALADEVGLTLRSFHHALEAYKIRSLLADRAIAVSTWADWWGFKLEAYDGIQENLALISAAGARAVVHSDSPEGIRRLNQEAAKGMWAGRHGGLDVSDGEALRWITENPAWALGVENRAGTLAVGKDADVVIWDRTPLSVYASAERVFIDGVERYHRGAGAPPWSDFEAAP